jgi:DDE superfamily endonuclease/Tc5 transposase DNA-binding domain
MTTTYNPSGELKIRTRERAPKFPKIEEGLWLWCLGAMNDGVIITEQILSEKASLLARALGINDTDFKQSNGWIAKFKNRHGIRQFKLHGEAESAPLDILPDARADLKQLLAQYDPDDVFNADETGLFWRMAPDKTLATASRAGKKMVKDRITVMFCCNQTGTIKIRPLVIGHAKMPRPFRNINIANLPVDYAYNKKAWMTGILFESWIKKLDTLMRTQNRSILLLLDNAPGHVEEGVELTNIVIKYFPPNTTSHLQPLDAGIIK